MITDIVLEKAVQKICKQFAVTDAFNYVKDSNPSNELPYHNWYHICCMVEKVVEGATFHNLPYRSIRHLIIAALFHDFGHSGGKQKDSINVALAVKSLREFLNTAATYIDNIDVREISQLIYVTEYPYVNDPCCIEQKIIRDADLMQGLREESWEEMIIDGLRIEMSTMLGKELTRKEMIEGQMNFLNSVNFSSQWGQDVFVQKRGLYIALIRLAELNKWPSPLLN